VDLNHELAGQTLNFDVELMALTKVRRRAAGIFYPSVFLAHFSTVLHCFGGWGLPAVGRFANVEQRKRGAFQRIKSELAVRPCHSTAMRHKHASLPSTASTAAQGDSLKKATFGAGCFWGPELHFQRIPGVARPLQPLASLVEPAAVSLHPSAE